MGTMFGCIFLKIEICHFRECHTRGQLTGGSFGVDNVWPKLCPLTGCGQVRIMLHSCLTTMFPKPSRYSSRSCTAVVHQTALANVVFTLRALLKLTDLMGLNVTESVKENTQRRDSFQDVAPLNLSVCH